MVVGIEPGILCSLKMVYLYQNMLELHF